MHRELFDTHYEVVYKYIHYLTNNLNFLHNFLQRL